MRTWIWLSVAMLALAGCADDSGDETDDGATEDTPTAAAPPEAIHKEGSLTGFGDQTGELDDCQLGDQQCAEYSFTLEDPWTTTITLVSIDGTIGGAGQVLLGADYDLFLEDEDGDRIGESTNPGEEDDVIKKTLQPGTYTVLVAAWNDQDGSYTLDIEFS